jgi:hypothetical protein
MSKQRGYWYIDYGHGWERCPGVAGRASLRLMNLPDTDVRRPAFRRVAFIPFRPGEYLESHVINPETNVCVCCGRDLLNIHAYKIPCPCPPG